VVDARLDGVDWSRFNQKPDPDCHPSSYGYQAIAGAYAAELTPLLRQPAR
jgi:lysophospholipase L1-like esterase